MWVLLVLSASLMTPEIKGDECRLQYQDDLDKHGLLLLLVFKLKGKCLVMMQLFNFSKKFKKLRGDKTLCHNVMIWCIWRLRCMRAAICFMYQTNRRNVNRTFLHDILSTAVTFKLHFCAENKMSSLFWKIKDPPLPQQQNHNDQKNDNQLTVFVFQKVTMPVVVMC